MNSDPIADMLTRIRNALIVHKESVDVPASRFKEEIARILVREGFLKGYEKVEVEGKPVLRLALKYGPRREKVIQHIRRVSRPGRRVYVTAGQVPVVRKGLGMAIISTSKGVLVDREARKLGVGGELICEVW
ncbi:MAG: 30S ribosomal protein S8 [Deinococcota bacterium]|uniref:Small ribosomal subunit protein uS8 n=1 Tax=Allomeiothermus silvanus (strain ATCC 700542 / DSM 9946 / NBRC 106475 / NCIMB 13440 / VI-R2) TaxID=526227 RepID=D7BD01_ALLS1|nr:30S ribosomal protein S8 [Allomeiothermus silvanus]ADH64734.1 ribosomal protein S8 [Allomeiothermus silvanus DSM 9946]MBI5812891.1 30S ribosomal protein S8 [Allomeiothermus silvanus]MCL6568190.1 30S ribosomal protein S8 [Allomeiothermus silvanus]